MVEADASMDYVYPMNEVTKGAWLKQMHHWTMSTQYDRCEREPRMWIKIKQLG